MHRRTIVAALSSLSIGTTLGGCNTHVEDEDGGRTDIDVMSASEEPHTVDVTVLTDDEIVFERRYKMDPREGNQSETVSGKPTEVRVEIDGSKPRQFEYQPPRDCEMADDDPKTVLTVYDADEVELTYGCAR